MKNIAVFPNVEKEDAPEVLARIFRFFSDKDVRLHFTEYGYIPLHNHETPSGNEDVTIDRILFLWGIIVRNRMAAKWPKCSFSSVYQNLGEAAFSYKVPAKEWKDWF